MSRWKFFVLLVLLLVSFLGVYLLGNGRVHLWDRDEPRYANASRWMARTQDWVVPRWGFGTIDEAREPRTAKPPLIYWAQAASMKTFGDTTFAARFPSAVATITLLGLLGIVLARSVGKRRALWTVFILGSAGMVVASSKMCVTDAVLLLFITTMLLGVASVRLGHRARWITAILWLAVALAGLTKGPVVLGVMVTTLLVLACFDRTGKWTSPRAWLDAVRWWRFLRPVMGLIIICVVVGPWLYLVSGRAPGFLTESISHDVINRMRSGLEGHKGPPGFYLLTIWGTYFPWSLLLPASLILAWRHRHLPHVRFALAAVIGQQGVFLTAALVALVPAIMTYFTLNETLTPEERMANRGTGNISFREMLSNRTILLILSLTVFGSLGLGLVQSTFAIYGQDILFAGKDEPTINLGIGLLFGAIGLGQTLTQTLLLRRLLRRYGDAPLVFGGTLVRAFSQFWFFMLGLPLALAVFGQDALPWVAIIGAMSFAAGTGIMMPPLQSLISYATPDNARGAAAGLASSAQSLGVIAGTLLAGPLLSINIAGRPSLMPYLVNTIMFLLLAIPTWFLVKQFGWTAAKA